MACIAAVAVVAVVRRSESRSENGSEVALK